MLTRSSQQRVDSSPPAPGKERRPAANRSPKTSKKLNETVTDHWAPVNRDRKLDAVVPETPGPESAVTTLGVNQNAPYSPIATLFRHCGFTHSQLKRVGDVSIYRQSKSGLPDAYEVVLIRKYEAYAAFGKEIPAAEYYPKSEDWGSYGWTYCTLEEVERKLAELIGEAAKQGQRADGQGLDQP